MKADYDPDAFATSSDSDQKPATRVQMTETPLRADPRFDRPIIVLSSPRSGSTLLFETLLRAPGLYTVGGESHVQIEGMGELHP